jgi:TonB family protein
MKKQLGVVVMAFAVLLGLSTVLAFAQQKQTADRERVERDQTVERQPGPDGAVRYKFERDLADSGGQPAGDVVFLATEMSFGGKVVKGAPYSAQAITENIQTLTDGNRIVNKSTATIYRDNEGRTRREQTIGAISGLPYAGEPTQTIFIRDPVAGTIYVLDPRSHTARQMRGTATFQFKVPGPSADRFDTAAPPPPVRIEAGRVDRARVELERSDMGMRLSPEPQFIWGWGNHEAQTESLGKQNMEGVEAEGTRSTVTIPAGEIGNERPLEIVNERWYSAELQIAVMTRHSDPRFGESSYRLVNIDRSEPARSLFEVPADYTVKSGPGMPAEMPGGADTFRPMAGAIGGGVLNGKALKLPLPPYPPVARAARASGSVEVEVTIDEDGNVIAARAVSGHPLLQAAAVAAAREAKFSPIRLSGQPVKVQGMLVYSFAAH